ncbi:oxidoreductase [Burkholderia sp. MSh2]|uniref:Putative 3-oxacyl-ACP reductase n=1 Tax=Burkholderia paludis TaxID=1506587 RepID=A0A6J5E8T9_9BURK|nr:MULTISPECIES: SDR family oxidoreductase [Burkholderia]KEZ05932.1 oxidoreductase [Burkholderia sp. MSh2]CAB3761741.1 3-oxoacyl-[acyl-carrier-protein] reductase FabG [Burkholderia paludis]VWB39875.1 putative 3-oxacyl-ACP reductase [Burkholderia paludis]
MNQVVVVSGGGTGIGLATATYFARRRAQVVIVGRRADVLAHAAGAIGGAVPEAPPVVTLAADLSVPEQVERVGDTLGRRFGTLDVVVNAAGGHVLRQRPASAYADGLAGVARRWTDNFALNTLSAVLLTEALVDRLRAPGGRIVFVSSIAAYRGSGQGCYGAAKAALHPYCHDLAKALGPRGITVNAVAPGYVEDTAFFGTALSDAQRDAKKAEAMNGRAATPADIADTIGWLASPAARHVTAQIVQVNGGAERGR